MKTLANRGFCKKKLDTRFDTHCIKTGVQLWSEWGDSNSRPPAPKAGALPAAQHPVLLTAGPEGDGVSLYYTYFFASVKCSNFYDDFFLPKEYNTLIKSRRDTL